jgi:hypothetical protein
MNVLKAELAGVVFDFFAATIGFTVEVFVVVGAGVVDVAEELVEAPVVDFAVEDDGVVEVELEELEELVGVLFDEVVLPLVVPEPEDGALGDEGAGVLIAVLVDVAAPFQSFPDTSVLAMIEPEAILIVAVPEDAIALNTSVAAVILPLTVVPPEV